MHSAHESCPIFFKKILLHQHIKGQDKNLIDPKNSNFKNRKICCRIVRFLAIFCEFSPKIKLDTGTRLEITWNMYPFYMTSCVNGFPFRYSGEAKTNSVELYRMIQGGSEPSILDDLCLGNVVSKYFSKLRFGTSKIQPELNCLENILLSFYESLLRARL